jgi:hypothetical protein
MKVEPLIDNGFRVVRAEGAQSFYFGLPARLTVPE